ncbi:MAG TPA: TMEM165/GDT1 family protein, partial [Blastocatellia bacterium]|nr:TMEM165/GDT1 family protein [Blastocatellia bacterium]
TRQPWAVFLGASLALAVVSLIGVLAGSALANYINAEYLHKAAAAAFIVIGILMLWGKM